MVQINIGNDRQVNNDEWQQIRDSLENLQPGEQIELVDDEGNLITSKTQDQLEQLNQGALNSEISQSGEAVSPADMTAQQAQEKLNTLKTEMDQLVADIKRLQQQNADQSEIQAKQAELQQKIEEASKLLLKANSNLNLGKYKSAAGSSKPMSGSANINFGGQNGFGGKAQNAGAQAQTAQGGFSPPQNWGAQGLGGGMQAFSSDAYMKTMAMEDNIMSSWDSVNKNTTRGKQLMMLFFYFARMAESGDMAAMYQFMKFITYIISKDKAKQQIEMGKKLIQLQELSRSWTNKLLNVQTNTTDPAASNELMKTMTIVKSETDAIATSQKLISQMMEEFAQVVETLTNTTKAALETAGRIMRTVSTMR